MKLSALYLLAGLVWGLILGALAVWAIVAFAAGVSWLYLFGDDPWPAEVSWIIPLLGLAAFLATLAVCLGLGLRQGREAAQKGAQDAHRQRTQGIRLLSLGLLLLIGLAGAGAARLFEQSDERALLLQQTAWFEALLAERQALTGLGVARAPGELAFTVTLDTQGARGGAYRLAWSLRATARDATLAQGTELLTLDPGINRTTVTIDARPALKRYHEAALGGRKVTVEVDDYIRLDAALNPVLSDQDVAQLPGQEAHNLELGQSALTDRRSVDFPLRFRIDGSAYELLD